MADDYYDVLGVSRTATPEDIKKAFRKKAHEYHPDKAGGDEEMFKRVNEAYQVLSDESKRSQYDRFGKSFEGGGNPFGGGFEGFNVNFEDLGSMGDIFSSFFGGQQQSTRSPRRRRGADIQVDATISFLESAAGVRQELHHHLYQTCERCKGNGAEPGTPIETCATCQGSGVVGQTRQTPFGMFTQQTTCPTCRGEGKTVKEPCRECRGEGRVRKSRTLEVDIPAGIDNGQLIRITGKGEAPPRGGIPGDIFIMVHVEPDKELRRDGNHVRSTLSISFPDAALGATATTRTLAGRQEVRIPAGTQPGTEVRLPREGFPALQGGEKGDHIVTITVEVPKRLSGEQKKLLQQLKTAKKRKLFF